MEKRVRGKEIKIRMDDALYGALKLQAKKEKRPMTRMVEVYIQKGVNGEFEWDGIERRRAGSGQG